MTTIKDIERTTQNIKKEYNRRWRKENPKYTKEYSRRWRKEKPKL